MPRAKAARRKHAATVLLSGGIDSTACARFVQERSFEVSAVFVDYGQLPARLEYRAAKAIAAYLDIPPKRVNATDIGFGRAGEIPGRNAFFVCSAILITGARPGVIVLDLHDGTPYYDCSEPFLLGPCSNISGIFPSGRNANFILAPCVNSRYTVEGSSAYTVLLRYH